MEVTSTFVWVCAIRTAFKHIPVRLTSCPGVSAHKGTAHVIHRHRTSPQSARIFSRTRCRFRPKHGVVFSCRVCGALRLKMTSVCSVFQVGKGAMVWTTAGTWSELSSHHLPSHRPLVSTLLVVCACGAQKSSSAKELRHRASSTNTTKQTRNKQVPRASC